MSPPPKRALRPRAAAVSHGTPREQRSRAMADARREHILGAASDDAAAANELRARAGAFFDFYRENPPDLDLGFYLIQGKQPRGLTPPWNTRLNGRPRDARRPSELALVAMGFDGEQAASEVRALFAHIVGLLLLGHTGRIRMFRRTAVELFPRYVDDLVRRSPACPSKRKPR